MKKRKLNILPCTVMLTALSLTVYVPGIFLIHSANKEITAQIENVKKQIEGFEEINREISIEIERLEEG